MDVLREQAEFQSSGAYYFTLIRSLFFRDQSEDRRLARAVPSHQANMFAGIYLQRSAAQNVLRAVGFVNVGEPKQHDQTHEAGASSNALSLHPLWIRLVKITSSRAKPWPWRQATAKHSQPQPASELESRPPSPDRSPQAASRDFPDWSESLPPDC